MKRFLHSLLFFVASVAGFSAFGQSDDLLVKFGPNTPPGIVRQLLSDHDLALVGTIDEIEVHMLRAKPGKGLGVLKAIKRNADKWNIEYVEPDGEMQGIPLPEKGESESESESVAEAGEPAAIEWFVSKTQTDVAHAAGFLGHNVSVTVLDSGADLNHPYVAPRVGDTANFVVTTDSAFKPNAQDTDGHGTACFTLVAQEAPDAEIHVGRVMYRNSAKWSAVAKGIIWGKDRSGIISISIGGTSNSFTLIDAVQTANSGGAVVIVAAGNAGNSTPMYPAQTLGAMAISATDQGDNKAGFSSYGNGTTSTIDACAPGVSLRAGTIGGGWSFFSGTSGSTPIVAGITALVQGKLGGTGAAAFARVAATADNLGNVNFYGPGRPNAATALGLISAPPPPTTDKPATPQGLTATGITSTGFTLTWDPQPPGDIFIYGYQVHANGVKAGTTKGRKWVFSGFKADSVLVAEVAAIGAKKYSDWSKLTVTLTGDVTPIPETWTEKRETVSVSSTPYAPAEVEQSRTTTTTVRVWEESNLGNIRNDRTETDATIEKRTVPVPTG